MRRISKIIIHHSASDRPEHDNVDEINRWHLKKGFKKIGYHYYLNKAGDVFAARELHMQGAHTKNFNEDSIGICCGGSSGLTHAQKESLERLVTDLSIVFSIDKERIFRHKDLAETECPNFSIEWLKFKLHKRG